MSRTELPMFNKSNPCLENCNGACCRNMSFNHLSLRDLKKLTESSTNAKYIEKHMDWIRMLCDKDKKQGIYYTGDDASSYKVTVVGSCPNLQPDNTCGIYAERPYHCRKFKVGSDACNNIREKQGLPEIPLISFRDIIRLIV